MPTSADRNLLFGILALQMDFITREQLIAGMQAWVLGKEQPLADHLVVAGALASQHRQLLEPLVEAHIRQHGDSPQRSLAAVSSVGSLPEELACLADAELAASLGHVAARGGPLGALDPLETLALPPQRAANSRTRFRILRPHAEGGLGRVLVAEDGELHREVALKEIRPEYAGDSDSRARFVLEAEITGGLEHPGIVPVYSLGAYPDGTPFYAMRFVRGKTLKEAIDRFHRADSRARAAASFAEKNLELRRLLQRLIDVCQAIDYAHSRGVLHRDLKPGNIMLGKYGETLVVDWGLAKPLRQVTSQASYDSGGSASSRSALPEPPLKPSSDPGSAPTQQGSAVGTPAFMSPEQAAGRLDLLGPGSDVFSLGATLYEILTGQPPYRGGDVLGKARTADYQLPLALNRDIPRPLEAVCLKALAARIENRYATAGDLAQDIERYLADEPVTAMKESLLTRGSRWLRRNRAAALTAIASLLLFSVSVTGFAIIINHERYKQGEIAGQNKLLADQNKELADSNALLAARSVQRADTADAQRRVADARRAELETRVAGDWEVIYELAQATLEGPGPADEKVALFRKLLDQGFRDDAPADPDHDKNVLQKVVLPALRLAATLKSATEQERKNLAALWAAQARLIERNPKFIELAGVEKHAHPSLESAALLSAHDSYAKARRLDDSELYAAGFGRTLLKLPKDVLEQGDRIDLLKQVMPVGETNNPSLLAVASRLLRRQAFQAQARSEKLRLYDEALRRHAALVQATAITDPFGLANIARVSASGAHLEAAFYMKIESADESRRPAPAATLPLAMTKHDHLQRAIQFANEATLDAARSLPEEALIAKGNAHEDLAHYYKLTTHYSQAIIAFEEAIRAGGGLRSAAYAWMCKGRCEFRAANDAHAMAGDIGKRQALFRQAHASLAEAIQQAATFNEPRYAAEAHAWMGYLHSSSASVGPGDLTIEPSDPLSRTSIDELKRMAGLGASRAAAEAELRRRFSAWATGITHFQQAAALAERHWKSDWALIFRDGIQVRYQLASQLEKLAEFAPQLSRGELLESVASDAQKLLNALGQDQGALQPSVASTALILLARSSSALPLDKPAGPAKALEVFREGEMLFDRPEDEWRAQRVGVILQQARLHPKADLEKAEKGIQKAESIARDIQDERTAEEARGNCLWAHGDVIYEARIGELAKSQALKLPAELYLSLTRAQDFYRDAEAVLARADDARTEANLKLIRSQRSIHLRNGTFKPDFTELEQHNVKQFVRRTYELRRRATGIIILLIRAELGPRTTKFADKAIPQARSFCDLLLPTIYSGTSLSPDVNAVLQVVEHKLTLDAAN
jgi:serine/threonine protein kinase